MDLLASASMSSAPMAAATTLGLIFLAEMGDKSQLVCMALAARYRHRPVLLGALSAFMVLNGLAVVFGVGVAHWLPERILAAIVATLFAVFGIFSLRAQGQAETEEIKPLSGRGIFVTTFLMLFMAEMGDKTQLAVAALAGTLPAAAVWIGATLALVMTSALGVFVGRRLLGHIPLHRVHQISGLFFLMFAAFALTKVF